MKLSTRQHSEKYLDLNPSKENLSATSLISKKTIKTHRDMFLGTLEEIRLMACNILRKQELEILKLNQIQLHRLEMGLLVSIILS